MFEALAKVHAEYLQAFFDEVDNTHGGPESYLKNTLGLTDEQLTQFRAMYLEEM